MDGKFLKARKWARNQGRMEWRAILRADGRYGTGRLNKMAVVRASDVPQDRASEDVRARTMEEVNRADGEAESGDREATGWSRDRRTEAEDAVVGAGKTARGDDEIPRGAVKVGWGRLGHGIQVV